jgi:DNA ligase-1
MITLTRPMLAAPTKQIDLDNLWFPLLASPKIDGIRALNVNGKLLSRTLKEIPNLHTQSLFSSPEYQGLDGELAVGNPYDKNLMQQTMSGVMSQDGTPDVIWWVFDRWDMQAPFEDRFKSLPTFKYSPIKAVPHIVVNNYLELGTFEQWALEKGFEGVMLRAPNGPYKQGRSTLKERYLLKVKRFEDGEAIVLDTVEQMTNNNEATKDERGYTKRSTHKAGKEAAGTLGALRVREVRTGIEFDVGTGFTAEQRRNLWEGRRFLPGKIIKYKHFAIGVLDKPRFPTFVSFRDKRDM